MAILIDVRPGMRDEEVGGTVLNRGQQSPCDSHRDHIPPMPGKEK